MLEYMAAVLHVGTAVHIQVSSNVVVYIYSFLNVVLTVC